MEERKNFFALLSPKSALAVGMVTGVLVLCTIGFVVLLVGNIKGKVNLSAKNTNVAAVQTGANANTPPAITKSDKPTVELFVMSYCPYGLQMEKAYLPVWELLKDKADISVKFVSYAMHGQKELEENTRQYCIAKNFTDKYTKYLTCFTGKDDYKSCLSEVGISEGQLTGCINATNKQYKIMEKFKDKSTWLSGNYPVYPVNQDLNDKYGVQGSPTLVANGTIVDGNSCSNNSDCHPGANCVNTQEGLKCIVARTAENVKKAICAAFTNPPAECNTTLSAVSPVAGFGAGTSGNAAAGDACGN